MSGSSPLIRWREWQTSLFIGLFALTIWTACFCFPSVWQLTGIGEENQPFLDLYGLLASGERAHAGFDSFQLNPLDPYHRPNIYTEWWLLTGSLGLTRGDTSWLGVALVGAMLVAALAVLKPGTRREAAFASGVLLSPPLLMAVNRANNDLVVFLLVSAALVSLRPKQGPSRVLGIVLLAISAALKYYPLAGLVVLLHARSRRELVAWAALSGLVLALAWPTLATALASASRFKPRPEWLYAFGAPVLWRNFHWENPLWWLAPAVLLLVWSALKAWGGRFDEPCGREATAAEREFLVGSAFIVGCFFLGASYVYKLVFALWLLPWLWSTAVLPAPAARWRRVTGWLLFAVLWWEGGCAMAINLGSPAFRPGVALQALYIVLTCQQVITWLLVACLVRWLFLHAFQRIRLLAGNGSSEWPGTK